jgi:hypothetical protein
MLLWVAVLLCRGTLIKEASSTCSSMEDRGGSCASGSDMSCWRPQCVTAVEPEWLAELGPAFFSVDEGFKARIDKRKKEKVSEGILFAWVGACMFGASRRNVALRSWSPL